MRDIEHLNNLRDRSRKAFSRKRCLHPKAPSGCSDTFASAHSVQRSILKKYIAKKGHVFRFMVTPQVNPAVLLVKPERVGVNEATTFYGFCADHDTRLFSSLENPGFSFAPRQIALLGYRAVCREVYQKDAEIASLNEMRDYASLLPGPRGFRAKDALHRVQQLARYNARENLASAKAAYEAMLSDLSSLRYYALEFSGRPKYFCAVAFQPEWDFEGKSLQALDSFKEYKFLCFSAWVADGHPAAVFCWHKSADEICVPFIESLRRTKPDRLANRILSMALEYSENVVFGEDWWDTISITDQDLMIKRTMSGAGTIDRLESSLLDDGLNALNCEAEQKFIDYVGAAPLAGVI